MELKRSFYLSLHHLKGFKLKKILIIIITLLLTTVVGVIIYVGQTIDNNKITKLVTDSIEGSLNDVKVDIGTLEYNLGLSIGVDLEYLILKDRKTNFEIFSLQSTSVEINIFSILLGGGKVDINIKNPVLNVSKKANGDLNLNKYIKTTPVNVVGPKSEDSTSDETVKVEIPSFIENSRLNFKLTELLVNYKDKELSKFKIDKVLLKNLNLKTPTAYELDSYIDYSISENDSVSFVFRLFGELNLDQLITKKSLILKSYIKIKDIKTNLVKKNIPDVESEIDLTLNESSEFKAGISTAIKDLLTSQIVINIKKEDLTISLKEISLNIKKVLEIIDIRELSTNDVNLILSGDIYSNLAFSSLTTDVSLSLNKILNIKFKDDEVNINKANVLLKNKLLELAVQTSLYSGVLDLKSNMNIDLLNLPSSISSLPRISTNLEVKNMIVPSKFTKSSEAKSNSDANSSKEAVENDESILLPRTKTRLSVSNFSYGNSKLSANGTISSGGHKVYSKDLKILLDKSKSKISFNTNLKNGVSSNFSLESKKIDFTSFRSFVPKEFGEVSGIMNLDLDGSITSDSYKINATVDAINGSLKGLKLKEVISSFMGKLSKFLPKKEIKIGENYDSLSSQFIATPSQINLKKINVVGKNKSLNLNLKGNIYQTKKESKLIGTLSIRDYEQDIKKLTNDSYLPLMLKGEGYVLTPSVSYTTEKIVKNKTKKEVDKLKNSIKEKAKSLFKGFKL